MRLNKFTILITDINSFLVKNTLFHNYLFRIIIIALFLYIMLPIRSEYKSKNTCINIASRQLSRKLPESYVKEAGIGKKELSKMLAYQICTHRNDN